jgi:hypothetical protein
MADINGIPYVEATDLVSAYPGTSLALATELDTQLGSKLDYPAGGSDGDLLAKDGTDAEWVAPDPGGLTLITSESFSAVSSVSINDCFTTQYDFYKILIRATHSVGAGLSMRLRASGTDTSSNYAFQQFLGNNTSISGSRATSQTAMPVGTLQINLGASDTQLFSPALVSRTIFITNSYDAAGNSIARDFRGAHQADVAHDGLTILVGSGTMTGTIRVYGYED